MLSEVKIIICMIFSVMIDVLISNFRTRLCIINKFMLARKVRSWHSCNLTDKYPNYLSVVNDHHITLGMEVGQI